MRAPMNAIRARWPSRGRASAPATTGMKPRWIQRHQRSLRSSVAMPAAAMAWTATTGHAPGGSSPHRPAA